MYDTFSSGNQTKKHLNLPETPGPPFSCQHKKGSQWSQWSPGPVACTNVSTGCLNCGDGLNGSSAQKATTASQQGMKLKSRGLVQLVGELQQQLTYRRLFFKQLVEGCINYTKLHQTYKTLEDGRGVKQNLGTKKSTHNWSYVVMPGPF